MSPWLQDFYRMKQKQGGFSSKKRELNCLESAFRRGRKRLWRPVCTSRQKVNNTSPAVTKEKENVE